MNRPKATRLRLFLAIAVVAAFAVYLPATASADFGGGTSLSITLDDPTPGAHSDLTVQHAYTYNGVPTSPSGCTAPVPPYPNPCADGFGRTGDDLKQWVLDTPAGFYGNPRAIPESEKCTQDQMNAYVKGSLIPGVGPMPGSPCPATAQVGTAVLTLKDDASGGSLATSAIPGKIYLVQSASPLQEVPTTLFTVFAIPNATFCPSSACAVAALSKTQIAPVTSGPQGDYRLRSVSELIDRPDLSPSAAGPPPNNTILGHISGIQQTLWGDLTEHIGTTGANPTGPFQTNPNTCTDWKSTLSSRTYGSAGVVGAESAISNASQTATLEGTAVGGGDTEGETYAQFEATPTTPDCSGAKPPLSQTTSASLTSNARGGYPGLSVTVNNPDSQNTDRAKKLVTTLPASISVNVNALGNICQDSDLQADTCPAASQVGTAQVTSPLLSAVQQGRVYMTKGTTPGLPYLSIWVDGAIKFRLDATTKFVGSSFNQIETTFDNLPELAFDKFVVNVTGGNSQSSLLFSRVCPSDGSSPQDGPITFSTTGYTDAATASSSATNLDPCYGVSNPSKVSKCVKVSKKLSVSPKGIVAVDNVANVQLLTGSKSKSVKKLATDSKKPFSFKVTLKKSKFKKNKKYYYGYRVQYKDGKVLKTKTSTFKTCK